MTRQVKHSKATTAKRPTKEQRLTAKARELMVTFAQEEQKAEHQVYDRFMSEDPVNKSLPLLMDSVVQDMANQEQVLNYLDDEEAVAKSMEDMKARAENIFSIAKFMLEAQQHRTAKGKFMMLAHPLLEQKA